jgi:poly(3-hydroxybutyrate) depolymerase
MTAICVRLAAGLALLGGCSSSGVPNPFATTWDGAVVSPADTGGATSMRCSSGSTDASGPEDADADAGSTDASAITRTSGCGTVPGPELGVPFGTAALEGAIQTMGRKPACCADGVCGAWSYARDYVVWLPKGYDNTKAYPLVFQGPGCGGAALNVLPLGDAGAQVIRVGLTPPPNDIQRVNLPGQGCFDDDDGDSSVDWVFYEDLYDRLAAHLCFDRNRVFASGNQGGGSFADALGCKYAGDAARPIRGVLVDNGGLPAEPLYAPTCTTSPMPGIWIFKTTSAAVVAASKRAISRAMVVNGCTTATTYDDATFEAFPIANNPAQVCQRIMGCPPPYPLVVCTLARGAQSGDEDVTSPAFSAFLSLFPPLDL